MDNLVTLAKRIPTETAAWKYLEKRRWNGRPVCPHCGVIDGHYLLKGKRTTTTGKRTFRRLWKCQACRKQFSVLVGTVMHGSKIPIRTWLLVLMEMAASKNGVAAREIQRKYGLTPKSAWHMTQRIREAMVTRGQAQMVGTIIADEAYIGGRTRALTGTLSATTKREKYIPRKSAVVSILCRETGEVRSRVVTNVTADTLSDALADNVVTDRARLWTDEHQGYKSYGRLFALGHETVNHGHGEYVRGEISTNAIENYFGQLKRSIDGTHHAVSHEHLHRYVAEFDFRFSTRKMGDDQRVTAMLDRVLGRRLTYADLKAA